MVADLLELPSPDPWIVLRSTQVTQSKVSCTINVNIIEVTDITEEPMYHWAGLVSKGGSDNRIRSLSLAN